MERTASFKENVRRKQKKNTLIDKNITRRALPPELFTQKSKTYLSKKNYEEKHLLILTKNIHSRE